MKNLVPRMMILIPLVICLNSCRNPNSYPRIDDQEQLSPVLRIETINEKDYISIENSYCLSRTYRISKEYVGAIDKAIKLHIMECNKVIGRAPSEYGVFATWLENFRHWLLEF